MMESIKLLLNDRVFIATVLLLNTILLGILAVFFYRAKYSLHNAISFQVSRMQFCMQVLNDLRAYRTWMIKARGRMRDIRNGIIHETEGKPVNWSLIQEKLESLTCSAGLESDWYHHLKEWEALFPSTSSLRKSLWACDEAFVELACSIKRKLSYPGAKDNLRVDAERCDTVIEIQALLAMALAAYLRDTCSETAAKPAIPEKELPAAGQAMLAQDERGMLKVCVEKDLSDWFVPLPTYDDWRQIEKKDHLKYEKIRFARWGRCTGGTDRSYCELCGVMIAEGLFGYRFRNGFWWLCTNCGLEYKDRFDWVEIPGSGSNPGSDGN